MGQLKVDLVGEEAKDLEQTIKSQAIDSCSDQGKRGQNGDGGVQRRIR